MFTYSNHIAVEVSDLDRAISFYSNVLNFELMKTPPQGKSCVHMRSGSMNFWLSSSLGNSTERNEGAFLNESCDFEFLSDLFDELFELLVGLSQFGSKEG